ncbi:Transgelin-3 [Desmophyllum pertusum]|uniref:Transgelin-3 n=1 Tax=Desmophyllum pertusum TaxID=174260 RepID=A0A9W9YMU1_9CNID|nr:Transgelin-3 [Desmophyllum pertusum]
MSRPKGFGLTSELENKKRVAYDCELAKKACEWMNEVCKTATPEYCVDFAGDYSWEGTHQKLKDGKLLIAAANIVAPDKKKKIQTLNSPFKLMENIGNFLAIADGIGVSSTDLFQTASLYDGTDLKDVINGMDAFARKTIKMSVPGIPTYAGPVEADKNVREFTEEQLKAGKDVVGM